MGQRVGHRDRRATGIGDHDGVAFDHATIETTVNAAAALAAHALNDDRGVGLGGSE